MRQRKYSKVTNTVILTAMVGLSFVNHAFTQRVIAKKQTPREIAGKNLPSTVSITAKNPNSNKIKSGSGFFVSEDIVVTNYHVVEDATEIYVKLYGQNKEFKVLGIAAIDQENDLVLLRVQGLKGKPLRLNVNDSAAIGDEVFVVSNPEGLEGTFSQGIVSSVRKLNGRHLLQITASISHGSSGGAVLNEKGEVIGIAVGAIESGQSLNFAVPVSLLRSMISSPQQYPNSPYAIANKSLGFSFQVHPIIQQSIDYYRGSGRTGMEVGLYRSGMFMRMARRIFKEEGIPENVAWTGQIQSNWESTSSRGLWGFDPQTAQKQGLQLTPFVDETKSFDEATRAAARYLKFLANRYGGNWELALAAYNSGEENTDRAIRRAGVANYWAAYPYLPKETQNYVPRILATILIANSPAQYGFGHVRPAPPLQYDRVRIPASTKLSVLAQASETSVQYIRYLNPHLRDDTTPPEPYIVNVPLGKANEIVAVFKGIATSKISDAPSANAVLGETWQTISDRTGVSVEELMAANPGMKTPTGKVVVPVLRGKEKSEKEKLNSADLSNAKRLYEKGQNEECQVVLRRVLANEPMNAEAYLILGKIHWRRGDIEQSISSFKTALFWDTSLIEAHHSLGKIYLQKGDCLLAKSSSVSASRIDAANRESIALQQLVERCGK